MNAIQNLTQQVVMVRLNSGAEINIGPGKKLEPVLDSEIRNNAILDKLKARAVIAVVSPKAKASGAESASGQSSPADARENDPETPGDKPATEKKRR
jgi:hypothetical protein